MDLSALKKEHRTIFCTQIGGYQVIFRPLTWREHDTYSTIFGMGLISPSKLENQVFREVVLDKALINEMNQTPPGLVPGVVSVVMRLSGNLLRDEGEMNRLNSDIGLMRSGLENNIFEQMILLICRAFPRYTPRDIEDLDFPEVIRLVVLAEKILGLEEPIEIKPKQEKSFTDSLFNDAREADRVDLGPPPNDRLSNVLQNIKEGDGSDREAAMARHLEMIRRMRSRR